MANIILTGIHSHTHYIYIAIILFRNQIIQIGESPMKSISYYFKRTTEPKHMDSEMEQEGKKKSLFGNFSSCY